MRILIALLLAIGTTVAATSGSAQTLPTTWEDPVKLDDQGFVRQWLILGPINFGEKYDAQNIEKDQIKDEDKLMPKPGDKVKVSTEEGSPGAYKTVEKELAWKTVKVNDYFFDLNQILSLSNTDGMGGYAAIYLDAPEEIKGVKFNIGSNDNCKVFLNGKKIHTYIGGRTLEQSADEAADLTLQKGPNVVIFKVWNDSNNWQGYLSILNKDGKPATTVTTRVPAPGAAAPAQHTSWEEPVKLDERGHIRNWLILGPINFGDKYNASDIDKDQIKDEAKLMPKAGDKVKVSTEEGSAGAYKTVEKELTWKAAKIDNYFFDLNQILSLSNTGSMGAYAVAYLEAPEEIKGIKFGIGSNDNCKIFLNGKKVHSFVGGRTLAQSTDEAADLTLQKGSNVVVFKVWNDSNDWSGYLRVLKSDNQPVTNVTVRMPK